MCVVSVAVSCCICSNNNNNWIWCFKLKDTWKEWLRVEGEVQQACCQDITNRGRSWTLEWGGGHCKKHIFTLLKDGLEGCKSMERAREKFINLTEIFGKYWLQQKKKKKHCFLVYSRKVGRGPHVWVETSELDFFFFFFFMTAAGVLASGNDLWD